jgi:hypothetical protein
MLLEIVCLSLPDLSGMTPSTNDAHRSLRHAKLDGDLILFPTGGAKLLHLADEMVIDLYRFHGAAMNSCIPEGESPAAPRRITV